MIILSRIILLSLLLLLLLSPQLIMILWIHVCCSFQMSESNLFQTFPSVRYVSPSKGFVNNISSKIASCFKAHEHPLPFNALCTSGAHLASGSKFHWEKKAFIWVQRKISSDGRAGKCHNCVFTSHTFPVFVRRVPVPCFNSHCVCVDHGLVRVLAEDVGCLGTACFLRDHTQRVHATYRREVKVTAIL